MSQFEYKVISIAFVWQFMAKREVRSQAKIWKYVTYHNAAGGRPSHSYRQRAPKKIVNLTDRQAN